MKSKQQREAVINWCVQQGLAKSGHGNLKLPVITTAEPVPDAAAPKLSLTITTNSVDRHGDILEPAGADLKQFLKNPVFLWAHEYRALPIGKATKITRRDDRIEAEVLFADTRFAQEVYELYRQGFLKACSVGFLPLAWDVITDEDGKFKGYHVKEWELLELSAVPVPANPDALANALNNEEIVISAKGLAKSLKRAIVNAHHNHAPLDATKSLPETEPESQTIGTGSQAKSSPAPLLLKRADLSALVLQLNHEVSKHLAQNIERLAAAAFDRRMGRT